MRRLQFSGSLAIEESQPNLVHGQGSQAIEMQSKAASLRSEMARRRPECGRDLNAGVCRASARGPPFDQEGIKGGDQPSTPLNLCSHLRIGSPVVEADILLVSFPQFGALAL
jgi:hypothetical protein